MTSIEFFSNLILRDPQNLQNWKNISSGEFVDTIFTNCQNDKNAFQSKVYHPCNT